MVQQNDGQTDAWTDDLAGGLSYRFKDVLSDFFASFRIVLAAGKKCVMKQQTKEHRLTDSQMDRKINIVTYVRMLHYPRNQRSNT